MCVRQTQTNVPSVLLDGWIREIERYALHFFWYPINQLTSLRHLDGGLKIIAYHGRGRDIDPVVIADSDIVISTYHTLATEATDTESAIYQIKWFRVVLDEGLQFLYWTVLQ